MRNRVLLLLTTVVAIGLQETAAHADSFPPVEQRQRIEEAALAKDTESLGRARRELLDSAAASPDSRASYYAAYISFRLGNIAAADPGRAEVFIDQCVNELRVYVRDRPDDAEAQALLGSCYGVSTRYNRLTMIRRGLAARRHITRARELAPQNPWVVLQDGLSDYTAPALFGGDRELAISKLERATELFDDSIGQGVPLADWGAAEAWAQLEKMYRETDRPEDAARAMAMACERLPVASKAPCPLQPL